MTVTKKSAREWHGGGREETGVLKEARSRQRPNFSFPSLPPLAAEWPGAAEGERGGREGGRREKGEQVSRSIGYPYVGLVGPRVSTWRREPSTRREKWWTGARKNLTPPTFLAPSSLVFFSESSGGELWGRGYRQLSYLVTPITPQSAGIFLFNFRFVWQPHSLSRYSICDANSEGELNSVIVNWCPTMKLRWNYFNRIVGKNKIIYRRILPLF